MYQLFAFLISTMFFGAQTPADTSLFAVAYVDVTPASKAAAVTALKQYRDASRKEEGFVRLDFFEQVGRPGRLAIIETWSNQKALDAHAAAAHTKQWRSALDSIRLSDYD
jgi:quinol monooxygenase YgiN